MQRSTRGWSSSTSVREGEDVAALIDKYGADPAQLTKLGQSVAELAWEQGHSRAAEVNAILLAMALPSHDVPGSED